MTPLAACTIVSKNYIAFARVLAHSFLELHPEGRFFVLIVDRCEDRIDATREPFTLIEVEELENIEELRGFLFKYTLLEANTAVKPFFMEHLFERFDLPSLIYFDPDILITHQLEEMADLLVQSDIVLTPHLTAPIDDDASPGELQILQSGAYNLGFIALRRGEVSQRLLRWWQDRLYDHCVVRIEEGLFVDQKWIDLVPGMFENVHILAHPGHNVAYWNLNGRELKLEQEGWRVNGEPLVFFHFSGIQPDALELVSKHQNRYRLNDLGDAADLYRHYRELLMEAGFATSKAWPYAFAHFDNGAVIPDIARRLFLDLRPKERVRFGDPFVTADPNSFFNWLNAPRSDRLARPPYLSRLFAGLHAARPELRESFPDVEGASFADFCEWMDGFGRFELRLDDAFLLPLYGSETGTPSTNAGAGRGVKNRLKRLYHSGPGLQLRALAKRLLGPSRTNALRTRIKGAPPVMSTPRNYRIGLPRALENPGINLVGYLQAETGMGEAARSLARALETTELPMSRHNLGIGVIARQEDRSFTEESGGALAYDVNLFVANADQVQPVYEHLGGEIFGGRYNIGFWLWELETFPDRWRPAFDVLHEIWTPSTFCLDALAAVSPIPVRRVPIPVREAPEASHDRSHFGLPPDAFIFLFSFNFLSYAERKNPLGLVRAFRRAFKPGEGPLLVLKSSSEDFSPELQGSLEHEIGDADVRMIQGYVDRDEALSLTAVCDCYVSLHRSEGFGLTLAEAMIAGKPVIATPYSGVSDFFDVNTGYPVRYDLVEIEEDVGPYPAGAVWAEPDIEHAAELMRQVFEHREEASEVAKRGQERVRRQLSAEAVGRTLSLRFDAVMARVNSGGP